MNKMIHLIAIMIVIIFSSGCELVDQEPEDQVVTIDDVLKGTIGSSYLVEGIVIGNTEEGILLSDTSGYIYVHIGVNHNYAIGNTLGISGMTESVGGGIQFSSASVITPISIDSYTEEREPTLKSPEELLSMLTSYTTGDYITAMGKCEITDDEVHISFTENEVSLAIMNRINDWTCEDHSEMMISGYVLNVTENNVLSIIDVSHTEIKVSLDEVETQVFVVNEQESIDWTTYISNPSSTVSDTLTYRVEEEIDYTIPGEYEVTLTVTDEYGNEASQSFMVLIDDPNVMIKNGDFAHDSYGWSFSTGDVEGGNGFFIIEEGVGKITVTIPVETGWAPRLESSIMTFEYGERYSVSFDVKADEERAIGVQVGKLLEEYPWFVDYKGYSHIVDVYQDWTTVRFDFTMYDPTGEGQLLFNMGKIISYSSEDNYNTTVYFDNISITKYDDSMNPPGLYGVFDLHHLAGYEYEPFRWVTAYDDEDGDISDSIELIGEYDINTPGVYDLKFRVTDSDGNVTEEAFQLIVEQVYTVDEVLNGEVGNEYIVLGTIVAVKYNGLLVTDDTGIIYIFTGENHGGTVGDHIFIDGITSTYGGAVQFDYTSYFSIYEAGEYEETRTPEVQDGASIEVIRYDFEPGALIEFTGTLTIDGNYTNITIDGTTVTGSLYPYSDDIDFSGYDGSVVTVTGYLLYFNGDVGQYMNVIATTITTE